MHSRGARQSARHPQGSPLSPLLANRYMRRFVLGWQKFGFEKSLGNRRVTYADDLMILCRRGGRRSGAASPARNQGKLKLTVNQDKTRICKIAEGEFNFLGCTFGRMYSARTGQLAWDSGHRGKASNACRTDP
jgi:RNA-directed DNA polymerase